MTEERQAELLEAARALVDKIDLVNESGEYKSIFTLAMLRRQPYTGPTFGDELDRLRRALVDEANQDTFLLNTPIHRPRG